MLSYIIRRLSGTIIVLFIVSFCTFMMVHLVPGDPVRAMMGEGVAVSQEEVERIRSELGLDQPLLLQYVNYMVGVAQGDLGRSIRSNRAVASEIRNQIPATAQLAGAGLLVAIVVGVVSGSLAAIYQNTWVDSLGMIVAMLGVSIPSFLLGIMLIFIFSLHLSWLPAAGVGGMSHLILPALTLGLWAAGIIARLTRSSMLEVLRQDYVVSARAKGLSERLVVARHAFRNALVPIVTIIGLQVGVLMSGSVIVETVFGRSGLGRLALNAIIGQDFPMVQGVVLFAATFYVLVNLIVDVSYAALDPRIRYS